MNPSNEHGRPPRPADDFATTHWSVVLCAGQRGSPEADEAIAELCRRYWLPLYAYARRRMAGVNEAEDLTQESSLACWRRTPSRGHRRSGGASAASC